MRGAILQLTHTSSWHDTQLSKGYLFRELCLVKHRDRFYLYCILNNAAFETSVSHADIRKERKSATWDLKRQ
jgi:hypothetical protein